MEIGKQLYELQQAKGLTQDAIGKQAGFVPTRISEVGRHASIICGPLRSIVVWYPLAVRGLPEGSQFPAPAHPA
jgi:transcriptional regulator with XRE-family HTH domain